METTKGSLSQWWRPAPLRGGELQWAPQDKGTLRHPGAGRESRAPHFPTARLCASKTGWMCVCMYVGVFEHARACVCVCLQVLMKPTAEQKQQLTVFSKRVASSVTELIQTAEAMKGEATDSIPTSSKGNTHTHTHTHTHTEAAISHHDPAELCQ